MNDLDAERLTGIGGSDAAAAIGISPWRTPYDLWMQKTGNAAPLPITEPMRWGTLLEPVIAAEYCRRTGHQIEATPPMLRHPVHEWLIGHIDGRVVGEYQRILEVKTAGIGIGWGEPGTNDIPQHYLAQCHHYLALTGAEAIDVAVLIGGNDFRIYQVQRDHEIAAALIARETEFWWHVTNHQPPFPINTQDAVRRWGRLKNPGAVVATEDDMEAITELRQCRAERLELEGREEGAKITLMKSLGEHGDTLVDLAGVPLATWKLDNGRAAFTTKARPPARRFLLKD